MRTEADFEQVGTASRRDGVEVVRYQPRFAPGSDAGRRARRLVIGLFVLAGVAAATVVVAYLTWPRDDQRYTSVLGIAAAVALAALGSGVVSVSMLLPVETAVERRPDDRPAGRDQRRLTLPLTRRPLLTGAVALGAVTAAAPFAARLLRDPHAPADRRLDVSPMEHTGWHPARNGGDPVRLVREDGTPIRPAEVSVGGLVTAFPGIPGGTGNQHADSPVMVIHLRREDAARLRENLYEVNHDSLVGDFVAYSKICTHVGCPASLYEQQTDRLLCPCHQSQFLVTDNARPVFGPAARSLAMLPIAVDDQGFFVATSDFRVPVGPSYWER
ncbi:MAG TPA: Rieske 2Fe-2S domain-containing protein [Candidatus Limnocylindrales bacterium]